MAEMANFEELDDQCSSSRSALMVSQTATRDSSISVSKFNRFIVGELARKNGDEGRIMVESLRKQRDHAAETHRQYGASLGAAVGARVPQMSELALSEPSEEKHCDPSAQSESTAQLW